jgi:hypothetical protein
MTMKFAALILFLATSLGLSHEAPVTDSNHVDWVRQSLSEMQKIKRGMTRADMERLFIPDGGFQIYGATRYVYRECPFFKVDAEFERAPNSPRAGGPRDKVVKISKPYVEYPDED